MSEKNKEEVIATALREANDGSLTSTFEVAEKAIYNFYRGMIRARRERNVAIAVALLLAVILVVR